MKTITDDVVAKLVTEFKAGDTDPLDGDDVDLLCDILRLQINLHQGNLTPEEYDEGMDGLDLFYAHQGFFRG